MRIALGGVTSSMGTEILAGLSELSQPHGGAEQLHLRLLTRHPEALPALAEGYEVASGNYSDSAAMEQSLRDCDVFLLAPAVRDPQRVELHRNAIRAAREAGVQHIVYLSFLGAKEDTLLGYGKDHLATEEELRHSGMDFTIIRAAFLMDYLVQLRDERGIICGPKGTGTCPFIAQRDVSDTVVGVLIDIAAGGGGGHSGKTYILTGPEDLTVADAVSALNRGIGEARYSYRGLTREEAMQLLQKQRPNTHRELIEQATETFAAVEAGELSVTSKDLRKLLGYDGLTVEQWAKFVLQSN
ncbi:hypothetical protein BSR29_03310 [Boudabousia liubingyangii]|uniref:NAD(P)-binding domain-containing protein n=1 Tax=Boudabousia liubingyangii TaxID=1921764 RepID=A0A1Q5PMV8_9ACTO|nr:NAD(P)H-binding protein [Boudabousia liubingyangii]OKL48891.1 hypothetical protein BSR29_03310 [Boudabousia liubingyangii]